jgi:hypothetical protein
MYLENIFKRFSNNSSPHIQHSTFMLSADLNAGTHDKHTQEALFSST